MIKQIVSHLQNCIHNRKVGLLVLYLCLAIGAVLLGGFLLYQVCKLLIANIEYIILLGAMAIYLYERTRKKPVDEKQKQQMKKQEQQLLIQNYQQIAKYLYLILKEVSGVLNLTLPQLLSSMQSEQWITLKGGYTIFEYCILKNGEVDTPRIQYVLQHVLNQKLFTGSFVGLRQSVHIYEGKAYPILKIIDIVDIPEYILIQMVWVNDAYCREEEKRYAIERSKKFLQPTRTRDVYF